MNSLPTQPVLHECSGDVTHNPQSGGSSDGCCPSMMSQRVLKPRPRSVTTQSPGVGSALWDTIVSFLCLSLSKHAEGPTKQGAANTGLNMFLHGVLFILKLWDFSPGGSDFVIVILISHSQAPGCWVLKVKCLPWFMIFILVTYRHKK